MIINSLPSMPLPHPAKYLALEGDDGESANLPSEILSNVRLFGEQDLRQRRREEYWRTYGDGYELVPYLKPQPSLVTIARSSEEGFTPPNVVVEMLQEAVLD